MCEHRRALSRAPSALSLRALSRTLCRDTAQLVWLCHDTKGCVRTPLRANPVVTLIPCCDTRPPCHVHTQSRYQKLCRDIKWPNPVATSKTVLLHQMAKPYCNTKSHVATPQQQPLSRPRTNPQRRSSVVIKKLCRDTQRSNPVAT